MERKRFILQYHKSGLYLTGGQRNRFSDDMQLAKVFHRGDRILESREIDKWKIIWVRIIDKVFKAPRATLQNVKKPVSLRAWAKSKAMDPGTAGKLVRSGRISALRVGKTWIVDADTKDPRMFTFTKSKSGQTSEIREFDNQDAAMAAKEQR
jgi:hypothetical protein